MLNIIFQSSKYVLIWDNISSTERHASEANGKWDDSKSWELFHNNFINDISGFTKRLYKRSIFEKIFIKFSSIFLRYIYYIGNDEIMFLVRKK